MADRPTLTELCEWINFERREELLAADLTGMDLTGSEFWGGNLSELNFQNCDFTDVNLFGADMRDADLRGANLTRADLHRTNFRGAIYNDETQFPAEFPAEERWLIHERDLPAEEAK